MTVYVEYALIDNLVIDYLILKATFTVTGVTRTKRRLFLCAFLGSVFALLYPLIGANALVQTSVKILASILIMVISGEFRSKKEFFYNFIAFFAVTFIFGGSASGLLGLFGIELSSEICVSVVIIPVYLAYKCLLYGFRFYKKQKTMENFVYKVSATIGENTLILRGFLDTGNGVYDGEKPVVFCRKSVAVKLAENGDIKKVKELEIATVNGYDKKTAFTIDKLEIFFKDGKYIYNNVTFCVTEGIGLNYDLLLHPSLFEVDNDESVCKIKKVS